MANNELSGPQQQEISAASSNALQQTPAADVSKIMLAITGLWYLLVGVKSFRWARQNRIANQ